ncbi:MAG: DUF2231 domain-containing protein [Paracoccaceae bacterium]
MLSTAEIHPILVHFPIVLIVLLAAMDAVAWLRGVALTGRGAYATMSAATAALAGIFAVLTYMFGDIAAEIAMSNGVPDAMIETHEGAGTTAAALLGIWALFRAYAWWRRVSLEGGRAAGVVAVETALFALVVVTAYFGGQLVYEHGVNVASAAASSAASL